MQIVCATGYYVHDAHPPEVATMTTDEIAAHMVRELTIGIDGTEVRAGVIGEIGTSDPLHPEEVRVLQAAAAASRATGAAVTLHLAETARLGHEILDILEAGGVDPAHVIMGHSSGPAPDLDYLSALARRGAYVQFDFFGVTWRNDDLSEHLGYHFPPPCSDEVVVGVIVDLVRAGRGERILLSHDTCLKSQLVRYGGDGYAHVLHAIVPQLRWCGLTEAEVDAILVANPRRVLAWSKAAY